MKYNILYIIYSFLLIILTNGLKTPFKHVIVLMLENHSYDNMLGMMDAPIGSVKE